MEVARLVHYSRFLSSALCGPKSLCSRVTPVMPVGKVNKQSLSVAFLSFGIILMDIKFMTEKYTAVAVFTARGVLSTFLQASLFLLLSIGKMFFGQQGNFFVAVPYCRWPLGKI